MYRITTKQKDYNEVLGSLRFVDGVAQTDDKWMAEWCRGRGFTVETVPDAEPDQKDAPSADEGAEDTEPKPKTRKGRKKNDEGDAAGENDGAAADGAAAGD